MTPYEKYLEQYSLSVESRNMDFAEYLCYRLDRLEKFESGCYQGNTSIPYKLQAFGWRLIANTSSRNRVVHMINEESGRHIVEEIQSNEFRERFAKSVAERIVKDWDKLVFNEYYQDTPNDETICQAMIYLGIKEE